MTSIGPDLPAHLLAKRKRDAEADADAAGPEATRSVRPESSPSPNGDKRRRVSGPSPNNAATAPAAEIGSRDRDRSSRSPAPARKVLGPSLPPAPLSERPFTSATGKPDPAKDRNGDKDSDSDSDDDYGPSLPSASAAVAASQDTSSNTRLDHSRATTDTTSSHETARPERSSWMTAPPTASELRLGNTDPSRHRARGFNTYSRPHSSAPGSNSGGPSTSWTETPEEKRARLQRAVLGITDDASSSSNTRNGSGAAGSGGGIKGGNPERQEDKETRKRIEEYNTKYRGPSLLEQHQSAKISNGSTASGKKAPTAGDDDDDPSKRGFEWEKDMNTGSKVSAASRKEMINRASGFGGKFSGGSFL